MLQNAVIPSYWGRFWRTSNLRCEIDRTTKKKQVCDILEYSCLFRIRWQQHIPLFPFLLTYYFLPGTPARGVCRPSRTWTVWSGLCDRQRWVTTPCSAAASSCRAVETEMCCCRTPERSTAICPRPAASSLSWRSSSEKSHRLRHESISTRWFLFCHWWDAPSHPQPTQTLQLKTRELLHLWNSEYGKRKLSVSYK